MDTPPAFVCDAMLGGLARWLRAAGYDAAWRGDADDWDVIRQAEGEGRMLLTCDSGIFRIGIVRDGDVPGLLLPVGLSKEQQLAFVLEKLGLSLQPPRCMACGGSLAAVPKEQVRERAPPRTFDWIDQFYECSRCGRLFWQGTHWQRIASVLQKALNSPRPKSDASAAKGSNG
jgi:uncharacterized protein with PIN domain